MMRTLKPLAATLLVLVACGIAAAAPAPPVTKADVAKAVADLARYKAGDDHAPVQNMATLLQRIAGRADLLRECKAPHGGAQCQRLLATACPWTTRRILQPKR